MLLYSTWLNGGRYHPETSVVRECMGLRLGIKFVFNFSTPHLLKIYFTCAQKQLVLMLFVHNCEM